MLILKRGAADVRLNVESQIQKALFDECEARLTTRGRYKRPSINAMGGCREIRKRLARNFDYGGRSRKTRLITALK